MRVVRAGYDQLIRAPTKTITFTGAAGAGAVENMLLWTLSGRVIVDYFTVFCSTTPTSTASTGRLNGIGIIGNLSAIASGFIVIDGINLVAGQFWIGGTTGNPAVSPTMNQGVGMEAIAGNIVQPITVNPIVSGVLVYDCWYRPITAAASLT